MERIIIQSYIYPAFHCPPSILDLTDQFAFRPSGSTAAALIFLLHTINSMLTNSPRMGTRRHGQEGALALPGK